MVAKADVFEEAGDYVVAVELPGAIADSVEIPLREARDPRRPRHPLSDLSY
jgi:HSP20 family molecular chaperone IbpA